MLRIHGNYEFTVYLERACREMPTKREISAAVLSSRSFEEGALSSITPSMQRHLQRTTQTLGPQRAGKVRTSVSLSVQVARC